MLILIVSVILILIALCGWLFLKSDPDRYIHEQTSPINFFFKWGRPWHYVFKVVIIILFMAAIFSLYKYLLSASGVFALMAALVAGIVLSLGKELLDKSFTRDDVLTSILGIALGFLMILLIIN